MKFYRLNEASVIKVKDGIIIDNTIFISNDDLNLLKKGILPRRSVETMPMNDPIKTESMTYKEWDEKVSQSGNWKDRRGNVYNTCIDPVKGKDHSCVVTVKHTLWWKIGTILSYLILIGMALWMLFQE